MSSIFKRPRSPYYFCSFRAADGRWLKKSTKVKNRSEALAICVSWEQAARQAQSHALTATQARKVLSEMVSYSTGEALTSYTLRGWIEEWLKNKAGSASATTMERYQQVTRDFLDIMGGRANAPLASVTTGDIILFRDSLKNGGRAVSTVNTTTKKILSAPFEQARRLGYIAVNPVAGVDNLKEGGKARISIREAFTQAEVGRLVDESKGEWRGLILLAATTGLRLGDAVGMKWANLQEGFIKLEAIKTHGDVFIPIHTDFASYLKNEQQGIGNAPVFPTLSKKQISHLSRDFRKLMEVSKVAGKVVEAKGDAGRTRYSKSFHCFRHYFISTLANAGVSQEVRQQLVAHSDDAVHKFYTHLERDTFRAAVQKIPSITDAKPSSLPPQAPQPKAKAIK